MFPPHLAGALLLVCHAAAQTTWIVGTGGAFLDLQQALDSPSVAAGDVLQLVPGPLPHEGFHLTKGVTIRGPAVIQGNPLYHGSYRTTVNVAVGAHARFVDLDFQAPAADPVYGASGIDCGGLVSFDNCQIRGGVIASAGSVTFDHCAVFGNGLRAALRLYAPVAAAASSFSAHSSGSYPAIEAIFTGSFHGSGLQISGPLAGGQPTAIVVSGLFSPVTVWLADSTITGSPWAIRCVNSSSTAQLARCSATGGFSGNVNTLAPLLGAQFVQNAPQLGMPWDLWVRGPTNTAVAIVVTFGLAPPVTIANHAQPVWWQGLPSFPLAAGTTGALGTFASNQTIPALPALRNLGVFAHTFGAPGGMLQVAPPTGGFIR